MKQFKLYLIFAFFSILVVGVSISQVNPRNADLTPEQEAMKQTNRLQRELALNPDQVRQLYDLNLKYAKERRLSEKDRAEMVRIGREKENEMRKILTKEQYLKLQSKRYEKANVNQ